MIHIACCSNEKLAPMFGVVMTSVGVNVKSDDVMMYLLHNGLKDKTIKRLHKIADRFHVGLKLLEIDQNILKDCPVNNKIHYADVMMYARLLLPSMLTDLDKVIYLDCDLVVNKDLNDLWDTDVNDVAVAMCPDYQYNNEEILKRLGIQGSNYLNSGVIFMNLDYWRKHNIQNKVLTYIVNNRDKIIYPDQDALNVILNDERIELPIKYNVTPYHLYRNLEYFPENRHLEITEARESPVIFHYMGPTKPWSLGGDVPGKELFLKYQHISGWNYVVIQKYVFKRILYIIFPLLKKKAWENKTYIDGWYNYYKV